MTQLSRPTAARRAPLLALATALLLALMMALPGTARAHDTLISSDPEDGATFETSPEAITVLAATITLTPGTVSCDLSEDGHALLVHCLHAPDPAAVLDEIKTRYEARLKEIFR